MISQLRSIAYPLSKVSGPTSGDEEAVRRRLKVNGEYESYWTLFQRTEDATEVGVQAI